MTPCNLASSRRLWISLASVAFLMGASPSAGDWPSFMANGDRTPPRQGLRLVDHLDHAPILWSLDRHFTVGKGLYPGHLRRARAMGIEPVYGGASSPIVADGRVFYAAYRPNGTVPTRRTGWRTMDSAENLALLPDSFFSVTGDDLLIAVDARTGEVRWEAVERDRAHHRMGHKRGHWCVAPAYADGRVFSLGTAGRLYAYDAATGEKLWETVALPGRHRAFEEHKAQEDPALGSGNNLKSSLATAAGRVIVSDGRIHAFDAATGQAVWTSEGPVQAIRATPAVWRHDGRDYLLANDGSGRVRLLDAADGRELWAHGGLGNQLGSIDVTGDVAILNAGSPGAEDTRANGLFAAYRLTPEGAVRLWQLPDEARYRHSWTMDRGAERRAAVWGDRVYIVTGTGRDRLLVTLDLATGEILDEQAGGGMLAPYPIEDRLLMYADRSHTNPVTASWWSIEDPDRPRRLHGAMAFAPYTTTGYEVPMEWPVADGVLYGVAMWQGLVAIDLRHPGDAPDHQNLALPLPAQAVGARQDPEAFLVRRGDRLRHGGFPGAPRMHAIDTGRVEWDGRRIHGELGIDPRGFRAFDLYEIEALADADGRLSGTLTSRAPALRRPRPVEGRVMVHAHQPAWMPPADEVLMLEQAVFQAGGRPGRLLLFLTRKGDGVDLSNLSGFADHTTRTPPILNARDLRVEDGHLRGTLLARFLPDAWARPLTDEGETAAAEYEIDARLGQPIDAEAGSYRGTYGVAWEQTVPLPP